MIQVHISQRGSLMQRQLIAGFALSLAAVAPAMAADMRPARAPVYTKAPVMAPVYSWTGAYAGISLGGRWADTTWATGSIGLPLGPADPTTSSASFNSSTIRAGGYIGYNWQVAPVWVVGLEGDLAWGRNDKSVAGIPGTFGTGGQGVGPAAAAVDSANVRLGWDASVRGRVGFLVTPMMLLYATGGVAWQQIDVNAACNGSLASWCGVARNETASSTQVGWTIGGGAETMIASNLLLRAEYRYSDYGNIGHTFFANTGDQIVMSQSLKTHTGLVGLAWKLGGM
jgi:outer membrane immunogenic protein